MYILLTARPAVQPVTTPRQYKYIHKLEYAYVCHGSTRLYMTWVYS